MDEYLKDCSNQLLGAANGCHSIAPKLSAFLDELALNMYRAAEMRKPAQTMTDEEFKASIGYKS